MSIRKNPVEGTHSVKSVLPIRRSLIDAVIGAPAPHKRIDIPPAAGASTKSSPKPVKHSDLVVLEVRRLHEQAGLSKRAVRELLEGKGIAITADDIHRYTQYQTRGALVPAAEAPPYI